MLDSVLGELDGNVPATSCRVLQSGGLTFESVSFNVERAVIRQCREQLPGLYLLTEFGSQRLNFVSQFADSTLHELKRRRLNLGSFLRDFGRWWSDDLDRRHKPALSNTGDLLRIQASRQQVLPMRFNNGGLSA